MCSWCVFELMFFTKTGIESLRAVMTRVQYDYEYLDVNKNSLSLLLSLTVTLTVSLNWYHEHFFTFKWSWPGRKFPGTIVRTDLGWVGDIFHHCRKAHREMSWGKAHWVVTFGANWKLRRKLTNIGRFRPFSYEDPISIPKWSLISES